MSDQPAMQNLMKRRPEYFRRLPTPVAVQSAQETVVIRQNVFLGTAGDMEEDHSRHRKVEQHCEKSRTRGHQLA
jgi:hypothetical protein